MLLVWLSATFSRKLPISSRFINQSPKNFHNGGKHVCTDIQTGKAWGLLSNICRMLPMFAVYNVPPLIMSWSILSNFCGGHSNPSKRGGSRLLSNVKSSLLRLESMLLFLKLPGRDVRSSAITPSFSVSSRSKSFPPRLQVMDLFLSCLFFHRAYLESSRLGLSHFFSVTKFLLGSFVTFPCLSWGV